MSDVARTDSELEVLLQVPENLWCLSGHFEGLPIVPGVVQLEWVFAWAESWMGCEPRLRTVEALKFKQILSDGMRFHLRLESALGWEKVRFRLWNDRGEFSTGRLVFDPIQP